MRGALSVELRPADSWARRRSLALLAGLALWMAYTRFFWPLHSANATLPRCPFLLLTGHPCPLCGGTRSFAYVWNGDLGHAVALYPLGPLLFLLTVLGLAGVVVAQLMDRDVRLGGDPRLLRALPLVALLPLAANWVLKLTLLPN